MKMTLLPYSKLLHQLIIMSLEQRALTKATQEGVYFGAQYGYSLRQLVPDGHDHSAEAEGDELGLAFFSLLSSPAVRVGHPTSINLI